MRERRERERERERERDERERAPEMDFSKYIRLYRIDRK